MGKAAKSGSMKLSNQAKASQPFGKLAIKLLSIAAVSRGCSTKQMCRSRHDFEIGAGDIVGDGCCSVRRIRWSLSEVTPALAL